MAGIQILKTAVTLTVTVSLETLRQEMGEPVVAIGPALASEIDQHVRDNKLGYYPALDFFIHNQAVEPELVAAAEHVAAMVAEMARRTIQVRLREPFSHIRFEHIQPLAMTMPRVRPGDANAMALLSEHMSPNHIRMTVIASSIEKAGINTEDYEKLVAHKMRNWLEPEFEAVQLTEYHQLQANS